MKKDVIDGYRDSFKSVDQLQTNYFYTETKRKRTAASGQLVIDIRTYHISFFGHQLNANHMLLQMIPAGQRFVYLRVRTI